MLRFAVVVLLVLLAGCIKSESQSVSFPTSDGVQIKGSYYDGGDKSIILLHMLGRNRSDWNDFANLLQKEGYSVLSIDLRGHGESANGRPYQEFSESDYRAMVLDVEAAANFLSSKGKTLEAIVGASIGANVGLNYASKHGIAKLVLLSPGLNYRGVETEDPTKSYQGRTLFVVGTGDTYSTDSSKELLSLAMAGELKEYQTSAHGTQLLPVATNELIKWLKS